MALDPLVWMLKNDLLTNILQYSEDIGKCATQITTQIREMVAARMVALFERRPGGKCHLSGICPDRRAGFFQDDGYRRLVDEAGRLEKPELVEPGVGRMGFLLGELGLRESFVIPLRIGEESQGMLLILDIMDLSGIEKIFAALQELAGLLALILKNSSLYRNLELLVEERTRELRESESRSRIILQTAMDGHWITDRSGQILEVNDAYCAMSGYQREELLALGISDLDAVQSPEEVAANLRRILAGECLRFETVHRRKDGGLMDLEVSTKMRPGGSGEIFAFIRDISLLKRTEKSLEKRLVALTQPLDSPEGIAFENLFNLADIQRLQDEFAFATGVSSSITLPGGKPITKPSNFCRLCHEIIRGTEKGRARCFGSDALIGELSPRGPTVRHCLSAGLWEAGAGISVGGHHIANWLIGQVRDEAQSEEAMVRFAREIGAEEKAVVEAFREVPVMSERRFRQVAQVLFTLANQLSSTAYQNVQQARFITDRMRAERFLDFSVRVLTKLNQTSGGEQLVRLILLEMKSFSGFEAVGIRLKQGEAFPFVESEGFPAAFLEQAQTEGFLDTLEHGLRDYRPVEPTGSRSAGTPEPPLPFVFSPRGSFLTNHVTGFLAGFPDRKRRVRLQKGLLGERFESVALIPLQGGEEITGFLHLGDRRPNWFLAPDLELYEDLAASIGIALLRSRAEELLRERNELLQALTANLQSAREEEKTRLSREIHDELGQILTGMKMEISRLEGWTRQEGIQPVPPRFQEKLGEIREMGDMVLTAVRRLTQELRPSLLDHLGLPAAMEWQVANFQKRSGIPCTLDAPDSLTGLPPDDAIGVYRILQETLTNVLRHAKATKVTVRLAKRSSMLVLEVRDNGVGIGPESCSSPQSLGLLGMRERARQSGGTLDVTGRPGKGTLVRFRIPLPRPISGPGKDSRQ